MATAAFGKEPPPVYPFRKLNLRTSLTLFYSLHHGGNGFGPAGFDVSRVQKTKLGNGLQHRQGLPPQARQAVFNPRGSLPGGSAFYQLRQQQPFEFLHQHLFADVRHPLPDFTKAARAGGQLVQEQQAPFAAQHFQRGPNGAAGGNAVG